MSAQEPLSLSALNHLIGSAIASAPLRNIWVVAETADMRVAGGHCYFDLVEKDPSSGKQRARMRAIIWATNYYPIYAKFLRETGQQLRSDLKVMVLVTVTFHELYGLSLQVCDIDASYTLGDVMQRRNRMIQRLRDEGILDMNRQLPWPAVPLRIAVVSARGAAGYGDFIHQLYNNAARLNFRTRLFEAAMQGERTAPSVIAALEAIAAECDSWDCVVLIRGGGATSDLLAFDNYDLAANIAQFPLPVVVGIGHERDITLLDYVANMRVKTPTAAAEWLVQRGEQALGYLQQTAAAMLQAVSDRLRGCHRQIDTMRGMLPAAATNALMHARVRLDNARHTLASVADRRLAPQLQRLDGIQRQLVQAIAFAIDRSRRRLDADEQLVNALSPAATLKRGYSITLVDGKALRSVSDVVPGHPIHTLLADGTVISMPLHNDNQ